MLRTCRQQIKFLPLFFATSLAAGIFALPGCGGPAGDAPRASASTQPAPRPVKVQVAQVVVRDLPNTLTISGSLQGNEQATISAKVGGRVAETLVDLGDRVGPGDPLARIDPTDYQIEVAQRELALKEALAKLGLSDLPDSQFDPSRIATVERARYQQDNARAKLERAASLMKSDPPPISEQEYADMQTQFEVARRDLDVAILEANAQVAAARALEAQLQASRQRLAEATIRAPDQPADGKADHFAVATRFVSAGEFVQAGTPLFRVVSDRPIKFRGAVPERFAGQVQPGQAAMLRVDGVGEVAGQVSRVNPSIDPQSRTFEVEILNPNTDGRLRPGGFARATITTGVRNAVSIVPAAGVVSFAGVDRVFTIKDGKATGVRITMAEKLPDGLVAINEQLPAGSPIILGGDRGIAESVPVEIDRSPQTQPARPE